MAVTAQTRSGPPPFPIQPGQFLQMRPASAEELALSTSEPACFPVVAKPAVLSLTAARKFKPRLVVIQGYDQASRCAIVLVSSSLAELVDVKQHRYVPYGSAANRPFQPKENVQVITNAADIAGYLNFAVYLRVRCHFASEPMNPHHPTVPVQIPTQKCVPSIKVSNIGWDLLCRLHVDFWAGARYDRDGAKINQGEKGGRGGDFHRDGSDGGGNGGEGGRGGGSEGGGCGSAGIDCLGGEKASEGGEGQMFLPKKLEWGEPYFAKPRMAVAGWEAEEDELSDDEHVDDEFVNMMCWPLGYDKCEEDGEVIWDEENFTLDEGRNCAFTYTVEPL